MYNPYTVTNKLLILTCECVHCRFKQLIYINYSPNVYLHLKLLLPPLKICLIHQY